MFFHIKARNQLKYRIIEVRQLPGKNPLAAARSGICYTLTVFSHLGEIMETRTGSVRYISSNNGEDTTEKAIMLMENFESEYYYKYYFGLKDIENAKANLILFKTNESHIKDSYTIRDTANLCEHYYVKGQDLNKVQQNTNDSLNSTK